MFIFVTLSSILLMGSLTGMLSNSFSRVITHAREEYLYVYSVYVLEASTSNRLTHFYRESQCCIPIHPKLIRVISAVQSPRARHLQTSASIPTIGR